MSERAIVKRAWNLPAGADPMTVSSLVDHCIREGIDPDRAIITGGHLRWESPKTDAEQEQSDRWHAESQRRQEEWERAALIRFKAKYEDASDV